MNTNNGGGLAEFAAKVRDEGLRLMKDHDIAELREIWRRLPKVAGRPPAGQRALAERIAMYLHELGDDAPKDLKEFVKSTEPLREFEAAPSATATTPESKDDAATERAPPDDGSKTPTSTEASNTMQTQTATTTNKRPGSTSKAPPPARKTAKGAAGGSKPAGNAARKAKPASSASSASKATSKTGPKSTSRTPRGTGPRAGSMTELVVKLTKEGKGIEAIAKACAKLKPGSTFATEVADGDYHSVKYYQNIAREKGWLPPAKN